MKNQLAYILQKMDETNLIKQLGISEELITSDVIRFFQTCSEMTILYAKKNHDYGNSFDKGMMEIGNAYGVGRLYDKMNRIITLCSKNPEINESIEDTVKDLACYAIMLNNFWKKSLEYKLKND